MRTKKMLKLELPKNPTIGNLAEPVGKYLFRVADLLADIIVDKSTPKTDAKLLREIIVHLLACINLLQMFTAIESIPKKHWGVVSTTTRTKVSGKK